MFSFPPSHSNIFSLQLFESAGKHPSIGTLGHQGPLHRQDNALVEVRVSATQLSWVPHSLRISVAYSSAPFSLVGLYVGELRFGLCGSCSSLS